MTLPLWTVLALVAAPAGAASAEPCGHPLASPAAIVQSQERLADGFAVDRLSWTDAQGLPRSIDMVPTHGRDAAGYNGGYAHVLRYCAGGQQRVLTGTSAQHPGHGLLVNHFTHDDGSWDSTSSLYADGLRQTYQPLTGPHHALYAFSFVYEIRGCPVRSTIHWLIATGQDHPRWAVTQDSTLSPPGCLSADARGPYGELDWDGDGSAWVDGVEWGTTNRFESHCTGPLTLACPWDNRAANTIPYVRVYARAADAEAGFVLTQTASQSGAGGYAFYRQANQGSPRGPMPPAWAWPYQTLQYELGDGLGGASRSKRLAWGYNYGALGADTFASFDQLHTYSGRQLSYAGHIVFGTLGGQAVRQMVQEMEANQQVRLVAGTGVDLGRVGAAGIGRSDLQTYTPAGYNPTYGVWELQHQPPSQQLSWHLQTGALPLHRPIFLLTQASPAAAMQLRLGPQRLQPGQQFVTTWDAPRGAIWLTYLGDLAAQTTHTFSLDLGAPAP